MPPKIIKLGKKDDIASVIKQIKNLRDREVVFQLDRGAYLLQSSDNLKLLKRTGEALGKSVKVQTSDELGQVLARKAGVLADDIEVHMPKGNMTRVARSDVKPRFSDILGSKRATPKPEILIKKTVEEEYERSFSIPERKSTGNFSKLFVLSLVVLVVLVFGLAVLLPNATVTVFARSEQVTRDLEITVDKKVPLANSQNLQIPGVTVTREVSLTKNFPTTGSNVAGSKATGAVTLYNLTSNTLTLRASTTTLVANGKKFFFTKDVSGIKPGTAGNLGIQITAEQAGEAYNLPANIRFTIENKALGNQNVYAVNPAALTGGKTTATGGKILTQEDVDKATESLVNEIINQAESDFTKEKGTQMKLLSSGVTKEVLAKTANKNVGDTADSFDMTMIARVIGLSFRADDVTDVVVEKINQVLSSDKYLLENGKREYTATYKSVDIPNAHGVLVVHFETTAAYKVDADNLSKILAGKNEMEIKEILLSKPEVDNVKVEFWPKWFVNKAPRFNGKVEIKTMLMN